ncbi:TrbC/VirB2 family protein [Peribacillus frigoritolerans]|uniref:TrbC/VirB2 family protein n=1 Tax=Peribacillus frigoritolerans TaxID=450367 RepID=UPI0037C73637
MKSLIERLKANQIFKKSMQVITMGAVLFGPQIAFAAKKAASPEKKYKAVIDGIADLLIGLSIPAAILGCIIYGVMYKFAGTNSHKKAEIIDGIKGTGGILIFVLTAGILLNWIAGMVK